MDKNHATIAEIARWVDEDCDTAYYNAVYCKSQDKAIAAYEQMKAVVRYYTGEDASYPFKSIYDYIGEGIGSRKRELDEFLGLLPSSYMNSIKENQSNQEDKTLSESKIVKVYETYLRKFIERIIDDDATDPQYSAITCRNRIELYLLYRSQTSRTDRYITYKGWLKKAFSAQEFSRFEEKVESEIERYGRDRPFKTQ